jgi:recombination protein RecR
LETFSSKLLQAAVEEFSRLPGIGRKTALRLVLHMLNQDEQNVEKFSHTILKLRQEVNFCSICHNISDHEVCEICSSPRRNKALICVVEDIRDVIAVENTGQYNGVYHVLGGIISPINGIGPSQLNIDSLVERLKLAMDQENEVILALNTTMEGDTTSFYIYNKLKSFPVKISVIARGIAIGDELEYADEITLGRSIINRTPYPNNLSK